MGRRPLADSVRNDHFGRQLQRYRNRARLSQNALAGLSTISVRAIRNLEMGKVSRPRVTTVRLLADVLRLTAQEKTDFELAAAGENAGGVMAAPHGSPAPTPSPLVGRDLEMGAVLRHLWSEHHRINTIAGLAGVGKTHLALAIGAHAHNAEAAAVLRVRAVPDPGRAFGANGFGASGFDANGFSRLDTADLADLANPAGLAGLARRIDGRKTLMIIDDNDRDAVGREAMWRLLRECPRLSILETRRSSDHVGTNYHLFLGPLTTDGDAPPARERADCEPAVALLLEALSELRPDFSPTPEGLEKLAEVCAQLDGLPGALQSAASWAAILSLDEVVEMSRTEPQTLATNPSGSFDPVTMAREATRRQRGLQNSLLRAMSESSESADGWTVEEVADRLNLSRIAAAGGLQALRQDGLIVGRVRADGQRMRFRVLNLVRAFVRQEWVLDAARTC
ncbi:helix-turn-helix domain-containing protein [Catenulispora rubra]|uniref:helix-turn-helix domain-containing protein n=1 Tax=Catenulispora rubra TaxID=280293 RepID=UPI001892073C|nr:helix-turn-helix domain-containing protein [Catenulispora rubra]